MKQVLVAALILGALVLGLQTPSIDHGGAFASAPTTTAFGCPGAPFVFPVNGYLGWLYRDPASTDKNSAGQRIVHAGIDIFASDGNGAPVFALADGVVTSTRSTNFHIWYPGPSVDSYMTHVSHSLNVNDPVKKGQIIGYQQGDHIHVSVGAFRGYSDLEIDQVQDPSPFFGAQLNYDSGARNPAPYPHRPLSDWCIGSPNVDVALIIDSSGSMDWNDAGDRRLNAARTYLIASAQGDKVGVVDFDGSARLASGLLDARSGGSGNPALQQAIATIDSSGSTNIKAGIDLACQELTAHGQAPKRGAILLTDGEHNVGPFGNPQSCFAQKGWPIYTFGFGSAGESLLRQIASDTGGEFKFLSTSDLVCEFQKVRAKIAGVTPGPCSVSLVLPAQTTSLLASVPASQSQATFSTSWPGSDVVMSLVTPSGRVIDRNTNTADVIHDLGATFEVYTVVDPEPGDWRVDLFGADVLPQGEETVFGFSTLPSTVNVDPPPADTEPPTTSASVDPPPNVNGWNNTDVTVTFTATDGTSGAMEIHYAVDSLMDTVVAGDVAQLTLADEGVHSVVYWAVDNAGNTGAASSIEVRIDKTAPDVMVLFVRGKPQLTSADGSPAAVEPAAVTDGIGTYRLTDVAGNVTDVTLYSGHQICRVRYRLDWCGMVRVKSLSTDGEPETAVPSNRLTAHKSGDRTWAEIAGQSDLRTRFDSRAGQTTIEDRSGPGWLGGETTVEDGHWSAVLTTDNGVLKTGVVQD